MQLCLIRGLLPQGHERDFNVAQQPSDKAKADLPRNVRRDPSQRIEDVANGVVVSVTARVCWELKAWILGFGSDAVVLEPGILAEEMRDAVTQMKANYESKEVIAATRIGPHRAEAASENRLIICRNACAQGQSRTVYTRIFSPSE
jgi:hypothetical protein